MKIYNSKAPLHYNQYWTLQDENKDLKKMASSILLHYIQAWGQDNKKRLETFADVANSVGFNIEVTKHKDDYIFKVSNDEVDRFDKFRDEVRDISRGNFEREVVQIATIITKYRIKKKWYQKLFK